MKIRKARKTDLKEILELFNSSFNLTGDDNLRYKAYHIKEYIEGPIFNTFVAEINKEIIGVVLIIIFKKAKYLYVENLIVKKEFRKSGVASNLESYVENIAKKNKLNLIYFYSEENNKAMAKLSKKLKFIEGKKWSFFWKEIK